MYIMYCLLYIDCPFFNYFGDGYSVDFRFNTPLILTLNRHFKNYSLILSIENRKLYILKMSENFC